MREMPFETEDILQPHRLCRRCDNKILVLAPLNSFSRAIDKALEDLRGGLCIDGKQPRSWVPTDLC